MGVYGSSSIIWDWYEILHQCGESVKNRSQKVFGAKSYVCRSYKEKAVRGYLFNPPPPPPPIQNVVNNLLPPCIHYKSYIIKQTCRFQYVWPSSRHQALKDVGSYSAEPGMQRGILSCSFGTKYSEFRSSASYHGDLYLMNIYKVFCFLASFILIVWHRNIVNRFRTISLLYSHNWNLGGTESEWSKWNSAKYVNAFYFYLQQKIGKTKNFFTVEIYCNKDVV